MPPWTEERRRKQAERIRQTRPWEKSTGPKTAAGKESSKMNAYTHGLRSRHGKALRRALKLNYEFVKNAASFVAVMDMHAALTKRTEQKGEKRE